jgi:hypothetical protein
MNWTTEAAEKAQARIKNLRGQAHIVRNEFNRSDDTNGLNTRHIEGMVENGRMVAMEPERASGGEGTTRITDKKAKSKNKTLETANRITANIIRMINMQPGCVAYRVNNVGIWDEKKQIRRAGNTEKGLPDIWACMNGSFVVIEVKAGSDKMSVFQKMRQQEVEKAKGVFLEIRSTDQFQAWLTQFLKVDK